MSDDTDLDELQVGTKDHTMALLGDILNNIVKQNTIGLPTIIPEVRGENEDQEIYQSDFDKIPDDVKILFSEAAKLVFRAKQAKHKEAAVIGDYTLTTPSQHPPNNLLTPSEHLTTCHNISQHLTTCY